MPAGYPMPRPPHAPAGAAVAVDQGVPPGLANAFTEGGTTRPIPADFGPLPAPGNAFGDPAGGMAAPAAMKARVVRNPQFRRREAGGAVGLMPKEMRKMPR